jgi:hypothetical protein
MPEELMHEPARPNGTEQDQASADSEGTFWQWLAIGVLIGCWLAEAAWCIETGV